MRRLVSSAWGLVRENWEAYKVINIGYYGLVAMFMVYAAFNQPLQQALVQQVGSAFMSGPLSVVGQAYSSSQVLWAIAITFLVNLFLGSLMVITLPSLIVPFSGLVMGVVRAVLWGLVLSPAYPQLRVVMIPHSITLLLEGQGYILALLAVYIQGRAFLRPETAGVAGHTKGYVEGLRRTGKMYVLVVLALAVAAIYEVLELFVIMKLTS